MQVHRARIRGASNDVAVKVTLMSKYFLFCILSKCFLFRLSALTMQVCAEQVQHPGAHELMMTDIRNHKYFASFLQRFDVHFDLISILEELEEQVLYFPFSLFRCLTLEAFLLTLLSFIAD